MMNKYFFSPALKTVSALLTVSAMVFFISCGESTSEPPVNPKDILSCSQSSLEFVYNDSRTIEIEVTKTDLEYTVVTDDDWVKISSRSSRSFKIGVEPYGTPDSGPRSTKVRVDSGTADQWIIDVKQTSMPGGIDYTIRLSTYDIEFAADENLTRQVEITSHSTDIDAWADGEDDFSWLDVKLEGQTLTVTADENKIWIIEEGRRAVVMLEDRVTGETAGIEVHQAAAEMENVTYGGVWNINARTLVSVDDNNSPVWSGAINYDTELTWHPETGSYRFPFPVGKDGIETIDMVFIHDRETNDFIWKTGMEVTASGRSYTTAIRVYDAGNSQPWYLPDHYAHSTVMVDAPMSFFYNMGPTMLYENVRYTYTFDYVSDDGHGRESLVSVYYLAMAKERENPNPLPSAER